MPAAHAIKQKTYTIKIKFFTSGAEINTCVLVEIHKTLAFIYNRNRTTCSILHSILAL